MGASTREAAVKLQALGFEERTRRGKGSHRWFVFYDEGQIVLRTMLPANREQIPDRTLGFILKQICLDAQQWENVRRRIRKSEYLAILSSKGIIK